MRSLRVVAVSALLGVLVGVVGASAAPSAPRAGCYLVRDAKGDHTTWTPTAPVRQFILDPTYDLTGLNVGMTPSTLTVYVSVAKLAARPTYGVDEWYETTLTVGTQEVDMWVDAWGDLQPARDAAPVYDLPIVPALSGDQPLRQIRKAKGAQARPTSAAYGGTPVPVSVNLDTAHSYVTWTFARSALEKAFKKRLVRGVALQVGQTRSVDAFGGAEDIEQDVMAGAVYRVGAKGCV